MITITLPTWFTWLLVALALLALAGTAADLYLHHLRRRVEAAHTEQLAQALVGARLVLGGVIQPDAPILAQIDELLARHAPAGGSLSTSDFRLPTSGEAP